MGKRILLVEGSDDKHVILALRQAHNIPDVFEICVSGGIEALIESLGVRLKESDLERLAVVVDADEDLQARWNRIVSKVGLTGFGQLPATPSNGGTSVELSGGIRFGVWIIPDNELPGILENFVAHLVPAGDTLMPRVDQFLQAIPAAERKFASASAPKARIHSWLAVQQNPGRPLGLSITARFLDANATVVGTFIQWIQAVLIA